MSDGYTESPHRSRKDTRRWCRGKPGVAHAWELVLDKPLLGARPLPVPCHWSLYLIRGRIEEPSVTFFCAHVYRCAECSKKQYFRGTDKCPDRHELPDIPLLELPCQECSHELHEHGRRGMYAQACPDGCECLRFWLYPKGMAAR